MEKQCAEVLAKIINRASRIQQTGKGQTYCTTTCGVPTGLLEEAKELLAQCPSIEHLPEVQQAVKRLFD